MRAAAIPLLALVAAAPLRGEDGWVWKPPSLAVPIVAAAPKIDGVLDDACWKQAARGGEFQLMDGRPATGRTALLIARDDSALYIAIEGFETAEALQAMAARPPAAPDALWSEDCVEVFIDPTNRRQSFFQIIASPKQATWNAFHATIGTPDTSWRPVYGFAAATGAASWTAEFSLPFTVFERAGAAADAWAFNVTRSRHAAGEIGYWSPVYNVSSHCPETFGLLTGMPATAAPASR